MLWEELTHEKTTQSRLVMLTHSKESAAPPQHPPKRFLNYPYFSPLLALVIPPILPELLADLISLLSLPHSFTFILQWNYVL